jgi:type IV pilus assembly protein PilM
MPTTELDNAVEFEARNIFHLENEPAQIRYLHAGEVRQGSDARQEVIVLAAKDAQVNDFIEQLHRCGVVMESLDFEPCAIYRCVERFMRRREDEQEVHVLVDIGVRRSQVVIGRGRDMSFYKPIDIGGQNLTDAVARKLSITPDEAATLRRRFAETPTAGDPAARRDPVRQTVFDATRSIVEELAREISLCLRYYSVTFRGHRPAKLRIAGGEAADPSVLTILNANLPLPVEAFATLLNADTSAVKPHDRRGMMSEWSMAFGLGLKMTQERFANRDGKKRDPNTPRPDARPAAEVVDLNTATAVPVPVEPAGKEQAELPEVLRA